MVLRAQAAAAYENFSQHVQVTGAGSSVVRFVFSVLSLFGLFLGLVLVLSNPEPLALDADVLYDGALSLPIWGWLFAFVGFGLLWGVVMTWLAGSATRRRLRQTRRALKAAERELDSLREPGSSSASKALLVQTKLAGRR